MPVFKNGDNGTWYVMARYVNWKGERKQKCKRGFTTKKEAQEWERMFQLQNSSDLDMSFEFKIKKDKEKLSDLQEKIAGEQVRYEENHNAFMTFNEIDSSGKKSFTGKYTVSADGFERSFAEVKDLLEFLAERGRNAKWIRKPTNTLRLAPLEKEAQNLDAADASMEEILEDTEKNTQLVLKMRGESYPVRDCAIRTILSRAGVNGDGLRKLDKATYAKVVNYCLRVAKGDALIKIADGKVSAVHGGDKHDYCILDMKAMFETTCEYLNLNFKGSVYMEGSGIYDHSIVSAMWKLGGSQELLDTYRKALDAHGMDEKILSPALRFTTSDVAASGANLYPMLLTDGPNGVISLGSPIKLAHDKGATILDFRKNLEQVCARYVDAMKNLTQLMDIEIRNPVNCLKLLMKELGIKQKIRNEVVELFVSQNGEGACTAHDLYYAMNEASFFAACEGMSGQGILKLEEDITKALIKDWKKYDVYGAVKC